MLMVKKKKEKLEEFIQYYLLEEMMKFPGTGVIYSKTGKLIRPNHSLDERDSKPKSLWLWCFETFFDN